MSRVWVTGDAVVDLIPDDDKRYLKCPGGAPANVAVAIARLSGDSAFFGRVGNDPFGQFLRTTLEQENVNCHSLVLDPIHRTSTVVVDLDDSGERSFTFMVKPSADQFFSTSDIPAFAQGEWLHCCSIALANEPSRGATFAAIEQMKSQGGFISFDPNLREEVWAEPDLLIDTVMKVVKLADVVKFSEEELLLLTGTHTLEQGIAALTPFNIPVVIITQGSLGALVINQHQQTLVPSHKVSPVDTTGAGDAFVGGLLSQLAKLDNWRDEDALIEAVRLANGCGALATTQKGAMTALPDSATLATFVNQ
ncbi:aminoimidazole riboside kinase [Vibrio nitrifigilis]|uniref:Aminoimidazole riboside kinase n=1 Tax=Vibrio nitrifigilis TaxID=2789781 RepID=A0ABS0GEQ6_9VIBR|nr:aminoimidazole riboside kinase [Vibrio nitrifigilis]MBF9000835.1 aminoimidazole riboside kinase [Vibrio nitrifigilis]